MKFAFNDNGTIKQPTGDELAEVDRETAILSLMRGTADDGRPFYAYIAVTPSKYPEFYAKGLAGERISFDDYGMFIAGDFEADPPPEVVKEMKELYGFDEQDQETLVQEALKQQKEFGEQLEKARIGDIVTMLKKNKPDEGGA